MPIQAGTVIEAYPALFDLLPNGGLPGVEYVLVPGQNMSKRAADGYEPTYGVPAFGLRHGDQTVESVILMCRGIPIRGASLHNGRRLFGRDEDLDEMLGYKEPTPAKEG